MYPKLLIDAKKVEENTRTVVELCAAHGLRVVGVSKDVTCDPAIARAMVAGGVCAIADSRVDNLMRIQDLAVEKWLIRTPAPSDAERIVRYSDLSLNSEDIDETARKAHVMSPIDAQTGPASRHDHAVMARQAAMLSADKELAEIYRLMSAGIEKNAEKQQE